MTKFIFSPPYVTRSAGLSCTVRCGCVRDKCQSRATVDRGQVIAAEETVIEEDNKENEVAVADIAPIMKSKRIVAPVQAIREHADMEMSFASQNILNGIKKVKSTKQAKTKEVRPAEADVSIDCSVLAPRQPHQAKVFSTPVYQKFKTNHIHIKDIAH